MARRAKAETESDELFQSLARGGLHAQKKRYLYSERQDQERQLFAQKIAPVPVSERVYLDEAGVEDTLDYAWGWSLKGTRCMAQKRGHRTQRVSMIAAWCQGQVPAPFTFEGYCDSVLVETWFEQCLLPTLCAGQMVTLDNASFHRKAVLARLLETVGCSLLALPAYSPDLNKIEPLWNTIKQHIKLRSDPSLPFQAFLFGKGWTVLFVAYKTLRAITRALNTHVLYYIRFAATSNI